MAKPKDAPEGEKAKDKKSAEARVEPQAAKPAKADPAKDYAAHPKFAKFKGES